MTATVTPAQLLAGADQPHGEHERCGDDGDGWDRTGRLRAIDEGRLDPDADTYGRHAHRQAVTT